MGLQNIMQQTVGRFVNCESKCIFAIEKILGRGFAIGLVLSANLRESMHCFAFGAPLRRFAFRALALKLGICLHKNVLHAPFDGQEIDARSSFQYDVLGTDIQSAALCDSSHANPRLAFLGISLETNPQPAPFDSLHLVSLFAPSDSLYSDSQHPNQSSVCDKMFFQPYSAVCNPVHGQRLFFFFFIF